MGSDTNGDGIGDTPYYITDYGEDNYPLIHEINMDNNPPNNPILSGPTTGAQNVPLFFTADASDPDYDLIQYYFDLLLRDTKFYFFSFFFNYNVLLFK